MRTDITKINEKTPHERLTECLKPENGVQTHRSFMQIYVNSVCCVHRFVRMEAFR